MSMSIRSSALRHGLLNLWAVEGEGDYVRLRYQAGRVDPQDYERWSRLEYDPDRLEPEDWAAWEQTSVRMTKKQLLDLLAIEVIAWPTRLEIRGVLSGVLPLSSDGFPESKTATKSGLPFTLRIRRRRKIFFKQKEAAA